MGVRKDTEVASASVAALPAKFAARNAQVGVIGMGYVGLPLALLFARQGFSTTGFDIDPDKVERLQRGESYIHHIASASVAAEIAQKRFRATGRLEELREMDAILICVPTPLDEHREPDLSYVGNTTEAIQPHLRPGQLVVLESTTYPGTTEEVLLPILQRSGLRCPAAAYVAEGQTVKDAEAVDCDFLLAFSPEREDPGNKQFQTYQIPKIVGGVNAPSAIAAQALYGQAFERTLVVSSSRAAEMTKLLETSTAA